MPQPILTSIEIAAPPTVVREKFLDFSQIPKYSSGFFKSVAPKVPGTALEPGVLLETTIAGTTITPTIFENKPEVFSWKGGLPLGLLTGIHSFRFEESKVTPGSTTFHQDEIFTGIAAAPILYAIRDSTTKGYESFNADLKKWVEGEAKGGKA